VNDDDIENAANILDEVFNWLSFYLPKISNTNTQ
jgi:hypothetical protein